MVLKVSMSKAAKILQVLGPQGLRDSGSMVGFQGFRRSPFMDLVFQGHQRAIRFRVSRNRGLSFDTDSIKTVLIDINTIISIPESFNTKTGHGVSDHLPVYAEIVISD